MTGYARDVADQAWISYRGIPESATNLVTCSDVNLGDRGIRGVFRHQDCSSRKEKEQIVRYSVAMTSVAGEPKTYDYAPERGSGLGWLILDGQDESTVESTSLTTLET